MASPVVPASNAESGNSLLMQISDTYRLPQQKTRVELLPGAAARRIAQLDRQQVGSHRTTHGWNVLI